jgi:Fic family protein
MYVRREAVLSSQIEGTQSTLDDVLAFEIDSDRSKLRLRASSDRRRTGSAPLGWLTQSSPRRRLTR